MLFFIKKKSNMSFNCSSLTPKQLYIIHYMQNTENTLLIICTIILLINFVITDEHGYTPLEILGKSLRNFMHLNNTFLNLILIVVISNFISSYIPVIPTQVFIGAYMGRLSMSRF